MPGRPERFLNQPPRSLAGFALILFVDNCEFTTLREAVLDGEESVFSTGFAFHFYLWRNSVAKAVGGIEPR